MTKDSLLYSPFKLEGEKAASLTNAIRSNPVSWDGYKKLKLIPDDSIMVIKSINDAYDQCDPASRANAVKSIGNYPAVLIDSIAQLSKQLSNGEADTTATEDLLKCLLTIMLDCLSHIDEFGTKIISHCSDPFTPLLNIMLNKSNDESILIVTGYVLTFLLTIAPIDEKLSADVLSPLFKMINSEFISGNDTSVQFIGLQLLKELVSVKGYRKFFCDPFVNVESLLRILPMERIELQMRYLSIYCVWILTFDSKVNLKLINDTDFDIIKTVLTISNDAVKEKIVRLSVSILINFFETFKSISALNSKFLKKCLLNNGLVIINNLLNRKWSDDELKADLNLLHELLNDSIKLLTNFDEYENELANKKLLWSPVHKNPEFWVDNLDKFKQNNWKLVKDQLVCLLNDKSAINEEQLYLNQAIVCYDISMLIKLDTDIIKVLNDLGVKTKIMTLMNSPNANVKFEALKTTQLMVANSL